RDRHLHPFPTRRSSDLVTLSYTLFRDVPAIARSMRIRNHGRARFTIRCAMSASLDLPDNDWNFVHLSGTWARERHVRTRRLELRSEEHTSELQSRFDLV